MDELGTISLRAITKNFSRGDGHGRTVLRDFTLDIALGKVVSILGESGIGKSTILNLIMGLTVADAGEVSIPTIARPVRLLSQRDQLLPWLTVAENMRLGCALSDRRVDTKFLNQLLEHFSLQSAARYYPSQLSGGMRRKVSLGRVLLTRPSTLLLDEPFSNLDTPQRVRVAEIALSGRASSGTIVMVTHDVDEAIMFSDRIVVVSGAPARITFDEPNDLKSGGSAEDFLRVRENKNFGSLYRRIISAIGVS